MKKLIITLANLLISTSIFAQVAPTPNSSGSGNCLQFMGGPTWVSCPDNALLSPNSPTLTLEAWIRPEGNGTRFIAGKRNNDDAANNTDAYTLFIINGNTLFAQINGSLTGLATSTSGTTVLTNGDWYHVALVISNTIPFVSIYINGVLDVANNINNHGVINTQGQGNTFKIGRHRTPSPQPFNGQIDEVRLWNTARTQAQIRANMCHTLTGAELGLVGYWQMDAMGNTCGGVTQVCDMTGNGNNGTLN